MEKLWEAGKISLRNTKIRATDIWLFLNLTSLWNEKLDKQICGLHMCVYIYTHTHIYTHIYMPQYTAPFTMFYISVSIRYEQIRDQWSRQGGGHRRGWYIPRDNRQTGRRAHMYVWREISPGVNNRRQVSRRTVNTRIICSRSR